MDVLLLLILIIILIIIVISIVSVIQIYRLPIQMKGKNFLTDLLSKSQKDLNEKFESKECQEENPWGELKMYHGKLSSLILFGDHRWFISIGKWNDSEEEGIEFHDGQYKFYEKLYGKHIYIPIVNIYYPFKYLNESGLFVPKLNDPNDPSKGVNFEINEKISDPKRTSKTYYEQIMEDYEKTYLPILKEKYGDSYMDYYMIYGDLYKKPFITNQYFQYEFNDNDFKKFPIKIIK